MEREGDGVFNQTTMSIVQLSKQSGIKYHTLYKRVKVLKWDLAIALSTPLTTPAS